MTQLLDGEGLPEPLDGGVVKVLSAAKQTLVRSSLRRNIW